MVTMLISGLMNVFLDALLIFNLGMGVVGAAWATAISQTLGAVWLAWYYLSGKSVLRLKANYLMDVINTILFFILYPKVFGWIVRRYLLSSQPMG